ncbi:MAG: GH92 family glycosyl hydrolase [Mycoplasmatales bacterium]
MDLLNYVNIDLGTNSIYRQSKGNTLPNVQVPFARQSFVLQNDYDGGGWFYNPQADFIEGVRISSQPSPWLGDYGHLVFLPFSGEDKLANAIRYSGITQKIQKPNYLQFYLTRYEIMTKIAPTLSGGICQINYLGEESKKFLIDVLAGDNEIYVEDKLIKIITNNVPSSELGYHKNFQKYYTFTTNVPIKNYTIYENSQKITTNKGIGLQLVLEFAKSDVEVKVATSYISNDLAHLNLQREMKNHNLLAIKKLSQELWNKYLATIIIEEEEQKTVFYSNMYHLFLYPRQVHELDEQNKKIYRSFYDGKIKQGTMISDVGFWDTYRTTMPLYRKLIPVKYQEIIKSILNFYQDYHWLPRWIAPFERGVMPSTLVDSVIAEAIVTNNVAPEQLDLAVQAVLKDGEVSSDNNLHGRKNLQEYQNLSYIPYTKTHESVSMTLDNAYSDYAIYQALKHVGHSDSNKYLIRSKNYQNLFNTQTLFFESKDEQNNFNENYDPRIWGDDFCESSGWQNRFFVPHDFSGLVELYGSKKTIEQQLDKLINSQAKYQIGKYGMEIHEMTEMVVCEKLGYLAISNQPSFYLPYIYLKLGKVEKARAILQKIFTYFTEDNYPGDEDNGSMSAWYILAQIGLYPYCPASGEFLEFEGFVTYKINKLQE